MKKIDFNSNSTNKKVETNPTKTNVKPKPTVTEESLDEKEVKKTEKKNAVDVEKTLRHNQNSKPSTSLKQLNLEEEEKSKDMKKAKPVLIVICTVAVIAGSATGIGSYRLFNRSSAAQKEENGAIQQVAGNKVKEGDIFGIQDDEAFKDHASGYLKAGGINGEGSHSLLRPGGESQTVYLTSSVTDLDKLVGMEIKIWGETFKGQKAGWLMDVGKVKVINPDAEPPVGEEL
ncbi:MAG: hypothetical protein U9O78_01885 [Patescibacteria group bacterium]|nr:hypothetical protein [Patescibacteria group bacterium]